MNPLSIPASARRLGFGALILLVAVLTVGCVRLAKEYPVKRQHVLDVQRAADAAAPMGENLAVRTFSISSICEGKQFVVRRGEADIESDYYNEFAVAPALLVTEQARRWFEDAGLFDQVSGSSSLLDATHALEGHISALQGDWREEPRAILELQLTLIDVRTEPPRVLVHRRYDLAVPLQEKSADGLTRAWNSALSEALSRFEQDAIAAAQSVPNP